MHPRVDLLHSDDGNIACLYLPPNTTSIIQPMDKGVLEALKRHYKRDLLLRYLNQEATGSRMEEFSKSLTITDAVLMSAKAWEEIKVETIATRIYLQKFYVPYKKISL